MTISTITGKGTPFENACECLIEVGCGAWKGNGPCNGKLAMFAIGNIHLHFHVYRDVLLLPEGFKCLTGLCQMHMPPIIGDQAMAGIEQIWADMPKDVFDRQEAEMKMDYRYENDQSKTIIFLGLSGPK